jgi:hypothetical protein
VPWRDSAEIALVNREDASDVQALGCRYHGGIGEADLQIAVLGDQRLAAGGVLTSGVFIVDRPIEDAILSCDWR